MSRRPELDTVGAAFEAFLEPLLARLDELEERIAELEAPEWLTLAQAAARYHTTADALRKRAQRDQLAGAVRDGSRWLVDRRALDSALAGSDAASVTNKRGGHRANGTAPGTRGQTSHA